MRFKSLLFGKAMSAALFVLLLSLAGMKNVLAQTLVATLQHEGNISAFYGSNALAEAYDAAVDGDTITLTSGSFNGCDFGKAITVHGAGCVMDTIAGTAPTVIGSSIMRANNSTIPLSFEGLCIIGDGISSYGSNNVVFRKCYARITSRWGNDHTYNLQLIDCIVNDLMLSGTSATIINSVVKIESYVQEDLNAPNTIYNSVLLCGSNIHLNNSTIVNSIIATGENNSVSNTVFNNCIGIKLGETSLFEGQFNDSNMDVDSFEDVFETFTGTLVYDNVYQLKEEIVNTFLGNDGTEVGIYGGMMPYNTRLSYMIMKHCNVAGRTTEDNKLSVEIELNVDD